MFKFKILSYHFLLFLYNFVFKLTFINYMLMRNLSTSTYVKFSIFVNFYCILPQTAQKCVLNKNSEGFNSFKQKHKNIFF